VNGKLTEPPGVKSPAIDGPRACTPDEQPQVIALVDQAMRHGTALVAYSEFNLPGADGKPCKGIRVRTVTAQGNKQCK
jgi:hypothetical protein